MAEKPAGTEQQARADRLAAALRDNLRRRKTQDRARRDQTDSPAATTDDTKP